MDTLNEDCLQASYKMCMYVYENHRLLTDLNMDEKWNKFVGKPYKQSGKDLVPEIHTKGKQNAGFQYCAAYLIQMSAPLQESCEKRRDPPESKRNARLSRLELVIQLLSVLTCVSALIVVSCNQSELDKGRELVDNPSLRQGLNVCVECIRLLSNPYKLPGQDSVLDILTKRKENGVLQCCADNPKQLSDMLEVISREHDADIKTHQTFTVSAQKTMKPPFVSRFSDNYQNVLRFNLNEPLAPEEHVRGVIVLEDGMLVVHTGYYFLYCSVAYRPAGKKTSQNWISYVHRTRPNSVGNTGVLLQSVHKSCQKCRKETSAYTGGVFLLKAGDFIQVMLSENGLINFYTESSYLGLVMLGT